MHKSQSNKTYFYDKMASQHKWDEFANSYETERRLQIIFGGLIAPAELKDRLLLDAGSGGGHFSHAAEQLGAKVVSMDVGINLLRQVDERCNSKKIMGSILDLPFKKKLFDVVLSTEVIEHTPDPLMALRELSAVVKPGGLLLVTVPCRFWNPAVKLATLLKLRPYEGYENFLWPGHLRHTLEMQGYSIEALTGFNFCPFFSSKLAPLFNFIDNCFGKSLPWIMVNIAIRARRKSG
ncbi:class I SAM-dependent methyltransferase [candidate division WS5 bacterium]|uniref:Class I SAM-dependent methyltransferase n=1 Tax=candidate division WS5 bacterium TaxID=2093353 RepID=A0A419DD66_9BACT|nr:MAG: class I SAM-dependent methyltransferase [candidate division WS5 bacterium]